MRKNNIKVFFSGNAGEEHVAREPRDTNHNTFGIRHVACRKLSKIDNYISLLGYQQKGLIVSFDGKLLWKSFQD